MKGMIKTTRTFGIEIEFLIDYEHEEETFTYNENRDLIMDTLECDYDIPVIWNTYSHKTVPEWKLVTDASVSGSFSDGFELVSPILTWDRIEEVSLITNALESLNAYTNTTCGLHVHHDIADYRGEDIIRLLNLYIGAESLIDATMEPSRRTNQCSYAKSMVDVDVEKILESIDGFEFVMNRNLHPREVVSIIISFIKEKYGDSHGYHPRYMKLNFDAYRLYGTVEFRQHHGTIDYDDICQWILCSQQMVEVARCNGTIPKPELVDTLMDYIEQINTTISSQVMVVE